MKLWEKGSEKLNKIVESFETKDDLILDQKLTKYDVYGSIAHAKMLNKIGILTNQEIKKLVKVLNEINDLDQKGDFALKFGDEDIHTKIENQLTEKLGDLGKKIHTARSRNDQVLVDLRLYTKANLFLVANSCNELIAEFLSLAKKYEFTLMPGYTHMQKAMPSSVGMWLSSFAESLLDDLEILQAAYSLNDQSPLGSGASYGVSLPIDRELTANLLGFKKVQNNSLYCQASRCKIQLNTMNALSQIMITLAKFAQDLLLFTTSEFNFFSVAPNLSAGSSIMPQKKNLELMEVLRAKAYQVIGYENMTASTILGLPSGYNADFGQTKHSFMQGFEITIDSLKITLLTVKSLKPNISILKKASTKKLFATHAAYLLVLKGIPFREAYQKIAKNLDKLPKFNPIRVLKASDHIGGPGNLGLDKIDKNLRKKKNWWNKQSKNHTETIQKLKGGDN